MGSTNERLIEQQYLDKNLFKTIMAFKEPSDELAGILLQHYNFLKNDNIRKNSNDSEYSLEYLKDVRKFIATIAQIIKKNQIQFDTTIRKTYPKDVFTIKYAKDIIKHGTDSRESSSSHFANYLEEALTYLSKGWFKMEFEEFVNKYAKNRLEKYNTASKDVLNKTKETDPLKDALEHLSFFNDALAKTPDGGTARVVFSKDELSFMTQVLEHFIETNRNKNPFNDTYIKNNNGLKK